ncbi:penicillin-binding protein activator LpoB [Escherichia coli]
MTTKMSRYALITALAMFLAGCVGQREPAPVEEVKPAPEQPAEPQQPVPTVPSVPTIPQQPGPIEHEDQTAPPAPHIRHYDSNGAMQPMVSKMLGADGVTAGSVPWLIALTTVLTVRSMPQQPTETLRNALANNGKFTLVSAQQLSMAKQQLGLSPQDS